MKQEIHLNGLRFSLSGEGVSSATLSLISAEGGVDLYEIALQWPAECIPGPFEIATDFECPDVYAVWTPRTISSPVNWGGVRVNARLASDSPILSLIAKTGENRWTVAVSDCKSPICVEAKAVLADFHRGVKITLFTEKTGPFAEYRALIRFDWRAEPFSEVLPEVREWYNTIGLTSVQAPEAAFDPVYSTWYSYLQKVRQADVLKECEMAAALGMKTVILDDGWQKDDHPSIYGFTGDWQPCLRKFPDMAALSASVHALGMKLILWFAVPFVGKFAECYTAYADRYLNEVPICDCSVLDPRYPSVRAFLIRTYAEAVEKWQLDGLKLDFIDRFKTNGAVREGMDFVSVEEATNRLLIDIMDTLTAQKPDILIEFRQPYAGIMTQRFGNMFRVWDCPNDGFTNRVQILNMRLLNGRGAVHSDMIDISLHETAASFAAQLIGTLFAVPQISVRLATLSDEQRQVLRHYLAFWSAHRETLMHGKLSVSSPELQYAFASAETATETVAVNLSGQVFRTGADRVGYCFNLSDAAFLPIATEKESTVTVYDCKGSLCSVQTVNGVALVQVPLSGLVTVRSK